MEDIRLLPVSIGTRAMHADLPEEDDDKYWVRILASNDKLDKHNSMMDPKTTLRNFEKDAKAKLGVSLKDHHGFYSSRGFGYGRSADAILTDKNELFIDFFILKGMDYEGKQFKSSEQLIRAIENDLVNQASIGFYGAREICNLCNLPIRRYSYWDWEPEREGQCTHKMGKKYENKNGKMEAATYTVYDARLKEVSLVEFGSNRHTSIEKQRFLMYGWGDPTTYGLGNPMPTDMSDMSESEVAARMRSFMEEFSVKDQEWIEKLRDALGVSSIRSTDEPDEVVKALETEVAGLRTTVSTQKDEIADLTAASEGAQTDQQQVTQLRDAVGLKDVRSTDDPDEVLEKVKTEVTGLRDTVETQKDEIADLTKAAEDGKAYREARVEEAIKQGVRAYGDEFDEEYHREYYGDMPLEKLETHIAQNKKKGDAVLSGGRSTSDDHEPPPDRNKRTPRQRKRRWR